MNDNIRYKNHQISVDNIPSNDSLYTNISDTSV